MQPSTERVLSLFEQINAIPRCSTKERQLSDWVVAWAADRKLECERDEALNVLIRVPGTGSLTEAPSVALQGHLDMVCEKTPDSGHDFDKDPIRSVIDGEWLTASQTTLGADNGIAVALALAVADDTGMEHPPLELLFTVDEETGLTGAQALKPGWLKSGLLLNLDSEDEGIFTVGCAGGMDSLLTVPVTTVSADPERHYVTLAVSGLQGGHSGVDIIHDRANANVLVSRVCLDLQKRFSATIAGFHGGSAHNAIPRDASAVLGLKSSQIDEVRAAISSWQETAVDEYGSTDPNLRIELREAQRPAIEFDHGSAERLIHILIGLPHGVERMSRDVANLVETSTNLATVRTFEDRVEIDTSQRSSSESQLDALAARIASVARLGGSSVRVTSRYAPWEPQMDSALLRKAVEVYRTLFESEATVEVIHAGLECGVIGARYPGIQMLSIGPTIKMAHSPDERMHLPSLDRFWEFLVHLLKALK